MSEHTESYVLINAVRAVLGLRPLEEGYGKNVLIVASERSAMNAVSKPSLLMLEFYAGSTRRSYRWMW